MTSVRASPPPLPPREPDSTLARLRERARGLEAGKPEWDALLHEFSRPLGPDDDLRARADMLRLILDDPWLGGFTGSQGRRVDVAAAQALVNLGEPYASELPAEARALLAHVRPPTPTSRPRPPKTDEEPLARGLKPGEALATIVCCVEMLLVLIGFSTSWRWAGGVAGLVVSSSILPAFMPRDSAHTGVRWARNAGLVLMGFMALPWLLMALLLAVENHLLPAAVIPLGMGLMRLLSAHRLNLPLPSSSPPEA